MNTKAVQENRAIAAMSEDRDASRAESRMWHTEALRHAKLLETRTAELEQSEREAHELGKTVNNLRAALKDRDEALTEVRAQRDRAQQRAAEYRDVGLSIARDRATEIAKMERGRDIPWAALKPAGTSPYSGLIRENAAPAGRSRSPDEDRFNAIFKRLGVLEDRVTEHGNYITRLYNRGPVG